MLRIMILVLVALMLGCSNPQTTAAPTPEPTLAATAAPSEAPTQPNTSPTVERVPKATVYLRLMVSDLEYSHGILKSRRASGDPSSGSEACRDTYDSFKKVTTPQLDQALSEITVPVAVQDQLDGALRQAEDAFRDCIEGRARSLRSLKEARDALRDAGALIVPNHVAAREEQYLDVLHKGIPPFPPVELGITDEQSVELGYLQCEQLDKGVPLENLAVALSKATKNMTDAVVVPVAAAQKLCPEHEEQWPEFQKELVERGGVKFDDNRPSD